MTDDVVQRRKDILREATHRFFDFLLQDPFVGLEIHSIARRFNATGEWTEDAKMLYWASEPFIFRNAFACTDDAIVMINAGEVPDRVKRWWAENPTGMHHVDWKHPFISHMLSIWQEHYREEAQEQGL